MKSSPAVALLILDGWGLSSSNVHNAIALAHTPNWDKLLQDFPSSTLVAHGEAVGMPKGVVGNSEVGHLTLGTGKAWPHPRVQLDALIESGTLAEHPTWLNAVAHVKKNRSTLHLISLLSTGGVHSHLSHLAEFLGIAKDAGLKEDHVKVHGIADGRDMPPYTAFSLVEDVEGALYDLDFPQMATLSGRFYAMDRDKRWPRTERAFNAIVHAQGTRQFLATQAVKFAVAEDLSEEFLPPSVTDLTYEGINTGDAVIFLNFRPDRMTQLMEAFAEEDFPHFDRGVMPNQLYVASVVDYGSSTPVPVFIPKTQTTDTLAHTIANAGLKQFHVAESEKYPHVTYFFNGGQETPLLGEDRRLIPSRRDVETYDQAPAMSVYDVSKALIEAFHAKEHAFFVANFANVDMVAHTGKEAATIEAVEHVDKALGLIVDAAQMSGVSLLITADHGNGESMKTSDGLPNTAHTLNPVPVVFVPQGELTAGLIELKDAKTLADVRGFVERLLRLSCVL
jgi:2,3-bisphosphoglycerate-independent phosphoglycerate mutase